MRKDFKSYSVAAVTETCDVWAGALPCKSITPRVSFPRLFLAISWRSCLRSFRQSEIQTSLHSYKLKVRQSRYNTF